MNLARRFTLMVKGNLDKILDQLEDPEQSLHQLILEMEEQLEIAKRAAAQAIANEDRLRSRIAFHQKDGGEWKSRARRSLEKGRESDAREALRRAEEARRQAVRLGEQLASQERDTREVRESVELLHQRLADARSRLQVLHARLRQTEARRAAGKALRGVERTNLHGEFERLGERVEQEAAEERAYLRIDDQLSGADVRRRFEESALDDTVEDQLETLREELRDDPGVSVEATLETRVELGDPPSSVTTAG